MKARFVWNFSIYDYLLKIKISNLVQTYFDFIELNINIVWQKLLSLVLVIGINIKCYFDYTQNTILIINVIHANNI